MALPCTGSQPAWFPGCISSRIPSAWVDTQRGKKRAPLAIKCLMAQGRCGSGFLPAPCPGRPRGTLQVSLAGHPRPWPLALVPLSVLTAAAVGPSIDTTPPPTVGAS